MSEKAKKRKRRSPCEGDPIAVDGGAGAEALSTQDMMTEVKALVQQNNSQLRMEIESMKQQHERDMNTTKRQHEEEMGDVKRRCEYLEGAVKVLAKDVKWEYSAPDIPDSHWIEQGHDERYVRGMKLFLQSMKNKTYGMRRGKMVRRDQEIIFGRTLTLGDRDIPTVLHDALLIPHWKELTDAIQLYDRFDGSDDMIIANTQLCQTVIDMLVTALKGKLFKTLELDGIDFERGCDGMNFAVQIIQTNSSLEEFAWVNMSINAEHAPRLLKAIADNPTIKYVQLENCCGEGVDGYDLLCLLLEHNKTLECIDLFCNGIQTMGQTVLPDFLATNPPLKTLYLQENNLNDNDAILIASALKQNTNLEEIYLNGNDITNVGLKSLRNAMFDLTSLNASACSNHTLLKLNGKLTRNTFGSPYANRANKLYSILATRHKDESNVHHLDLEFGDDSVKFVPKVLECVHSYSKGKARRKKSVTPLSIIYEILRGWRMPELYECK